MTGSALAVVPVTTVVGIAGLVGAGRTELVRLIFGADPVDGGVVTVDGRRLRHGSPRAAREFGLGLVPEDRKSQGPVLGLRLTQTLASQPLTGCHTAVPLTGALFSEDAGDLYVILLDEELEIAAV